MLRGGRSSTLQHRIMALKRGSGSRRLQTSEANGGAADVRASRAARMRNAMKTSERDSAKGVSKNDEFVISSSQKLMLGSLVASVGLATWGSYEIRTNPLGGLATAYRGSFLESMWNWMQDNIFSSFDSVYEPFSDQLIPTWEAGPFYGPVPPGQPAPPLLVVDLEETLIGRVHDAKHGWRYVKRPGLQKFIDRLSQYYEVVIHSEGDKNIEVLEAIDPERKCHKLGAESAQAKAGVMLKRLDCMNRPMRQIVLIDDSSAASELFPRNTLLIKPFDDVNDKTDTALLDLIPLLQALVHDGVKDFRECFDDLGTHDASEAVEEYMMRVGNAKEVLKKKRRKGLGGLISKEKGGSDYSGAESESGSLLSQIVGDAPPGLGGPVGGGQVSTQPTNLDLSGVGAGIHTGVGATTDKAPVKREKKKGALFQWLEDSQQESDKVRMRKIEKMNELAAERAMQKDEEKKKKQQSM